MSKAIIQDVLLVTDDPAGTENLFSHLQAKCLADSVVLDRKAKIDPATARILLVQINLSDDAIVNLLKKALNRRTPAQPIIFLARKDNRTAYVQAQAMGSAAIFDPRLEPSEIVGHVLHFMATTTKNMKSVRKGSEDARDIMSTTMDVLADNIRGGDKLSLGSVTDCSDALIEASTRYGVGPILSAIREHQSFTYRHTMIVTLMTTSLANNYNMKLSDVERLTIGALMHDVGKFVMSTKILDKPGALTDNERRVIERHPIDGAILLKNSGEFDDEIIDIARHHHELLDGSGYPDKLKGSEIKDIVRIVTVADIFSALIESRSYRDSMSAEDAYQVLLDMGGKLDQAVVQAFKPVALASISDREVRKLVNPAA